MPRYRLVLPIMLLAVVFGCSNKEEELKMKRDIANLQEKIYRLEGDNERAQKQLQEKLDEIEVLLQDRRKAAEVGNRLTDLEEASSRLDARLDALKEEVDSIKRTGTEVRLTPSSNAPAEEDGGASTSTETVSGSAVQAQFNTAYGDFNRGKFELAAFGFQEILRNFPNSPFTESSHYYLGRSNYELQKWPDAVEEFSVVLDKYPNSDFSKGAMLYLGYCHREMNSHAKAVSVIRRLIEAYPDSQEAQLGQRFLKKFGYAQ